MTLPEIVGAVVVLVGGGWLGVVIKGQYDKKQAAASTGKTEAETDKLKIENEKTFTAYLKEQLAEVFTALEENKKEMDEIKRDFTDCKDTNELLKKEIGLLKVLITKQNLIIEELKDRK